MLVVDSVTKTYRNTKAVVDVSMRLADGEALGIVGHNGAGKSTLMKVVAGLVVPDAGTVEADGIVLPPGSGVAAAKQAGDQAGQPGSRPVPGPAGPGERCAGAPGDVLGGAAIGAETPLVSSRRSWRPFSQADGSRPTGEREPSRSPNSR